MVDFAEWNSLLNIAFTSQLGTWFTTLLVVIGLLVGYGLLYLVFWLNRTRLYDVPTLEEMAYLMQQDALESLGEREFSRRLLDFEKMVGNDLEKSFKFLAITQDVTTRQIGYCWLCRQGYGKMKVTWLWNKLEKYKSPGKQALQTTFNQKHED